MSPLGVARLLPTAHARRPHALALSALLHGLLAVAWLLMPPMAPHDVGAAPLVVELLNVPPPPEPEPPSPQPPQPELAKPAPLPKPAPSPKPSPAPRPVPATPVAPPPAPSPAAQPVSSEPPAAPVPAAAEPSAGALPVAAPAMRGAERDDYLRLVWARVMRFRPERVPFAGTARLRFTLAADGALVTAELAESSGSGMLDRAALDALHRAAPFPTPPPGLADPTFEIPFQFRPAGR